MGYKALQKLWNPAGSGYGASPDTTPQLRNHEVGVLRYNEEKGEWEKKYAPFLPGEKDYVNSHNTNIEFYSIASAESAKFIPMDVEYSEDFASEWNHQNVYGRNDPLSTFQGTKRTVSLQFVVNASSLWHAQQNMVEMGNLASLMYPTYKRTQHAKPGSWANHNNASLIHTAPLLKVHFNNLIVDPSRISGGSAAVNGMAKNVGLVCAASDLKLEPVMDNGVIITTGHSDDQEIGWLKDDLGSRPKDSRIYPKTWKVSTSLTVFHTFPMGYERTNGNSSKGGPNAYDRGINGFGSFPWGEKHVYDQQYVVKNSSDADARRYAREAAKLFGIKW